MLEARELRVSYGAAPAISGVDLSVAAGSLVVVVGPNGAGKTTLINAIAGLHRPDAGTLRIVPVDAPEAEITSSWACYAGRRLSAPARTFVDVLATLSRPG